MNQWDSKGSDDKLCCWDPLLSSQSNDFAFGQKSWNDTLLSGVGEPTFRQFIPWAETLQFFIQPFCSKSPSDSYLTGGEHLEWVHLKSDVLRN